MLIGFYWPFKEEYDPRDLVRSLHAKGTRLALPVVVEKAKPVIFRERRPGMPMSHGVWNIPLPTGGEPVAPDVLLVLLVGFDRQAYRLGYGGGYYDRILAALPAKPRTIGIAWPSDEHSHEADHASGHVLKRHVPFSAAHESVAREHASGPQPVYTIGHSTRTILEFVDLLRIVDIEWVVDIRSVPRSRTNPQFNLDMLPHELSSWQIGHTQIPELGGLRKKSRTVPPDVNAFWTNQSFHNYADYALSGIRRVSPRLLAPVRAKSGSTVRDHVFGSRLVALSSKDCRRLPPAWRHPRVSFDGACSR